jgi:hypothetical protein
MGIAFDFQYKRVRNGHRKDKYHILEKWFHVTQVKQTSSVCNIYLLFVHVEARNIHIVKPVLRGHLWDKEKMTF